LPPGAWKGAEALFVMRALHLTGECLVDLLGKKKLEEKIVDLTSQLSGLISRVAELEDEKNRLLRQLDKREEKVRTLTQSYQEASVELKSMTQKAEVLQVRKEDGADVAVAEPERVRSETFSPHWIKNLIQRLESCRSPRDDLVTAYLRKGAKEDVEELPKDVRNILMGIGSERGVALFHYPLLFTLAFVPPFPLIETVVKEGPLFDLDPLRGYLDVPVLVIAARAGETLLGVALSNEGFEEHHVVKSTVKEKHSKGGWSQKRFERLRDEDVRQHADLVKREIPALMKSYRSLLVYAVVSGDPVLTKQIISILDIPVIEAKIGRFESKRIDQVLDEIYGFVCYRW